MSFFEDDDEEEVEEVPKEESKTKKTEKDKKKKPKKEEIDEEDYPANILDLVSIGIDPKAVEGYLKKYPNKQIVTRKHLPTQEIFKYYLKHATDEQLAKLHTLKLKGTPLTELYLKRAKIEEEDEEDKEDKEDEEDEETEEDEEIEEEISDNKEISDLRKENNKLRKLIHNFKKNTEFLYDMNGKLLRELNKNEIPFKISKEDIAIVKKIKELVK